MVWAYNARILAIFAVALLHVASNVVDVPGSIGSTQWWIGNIYDASTRWCVPVFVMLSGALLLSDAKNESAFVFYKKRLSKLFIPILFWTIFYIGWAVYSGPIKGYSPSRYEIVRDALSGKPYYHMWFLYMILGLYFVTPFIRKIVKNATGKEIVFLVVTLFIAAIANDAMKNFYPNHIALFINLFPPFLPYFILGHLIEKTRWQLNRFIAVLVFFISAICTGLGYFWFVKRYGLDKAYFYDYLSITVIPMSISAVLMLKTFDKYIVSSHATQKLAALVLGIYLIHPVIKELLEQHNVNAAHYNALFAIPLISAVVIVGSMLIAELISRTPYLRRTI